MANNTDEFSTFMSELEKADIPSETLETVAPETQTAITPEVTPLEEFEAFITDEAPTATEMATDLQSGIGLPEDISGLRTGAPELKERLRAMTRRGEEEAERLRGEAPLAALQATFGGEVIGEAIGATATEILQAPEERERFENLKQRLLEENPQQKAKIEKASLDELVTFPETKDLLLDIGEVALDLAGEKILGFALGKIATKIPATQLAKLKKAADISEAIIPKRTAKLEAEALQKQLFQEPKFFQRIFGGKRAIAPTEELVRDGQIISEVIKKPKIKNLQEFIGQLKETGRGIRDKIRPQLKETIISPENIDEILTIGKEIEDDVLKTFDDLPTADRKAFNKFREKLLNAKNLDDLWDARIEWDNWLPKAVKQAGAGSDAKLLTRQDVWMQNRRKINEAITKFAPEGTDFAKALDQMRALINAQGNISTKGSEFAKIKGIIPRWLKGAVAGAATGAAGITALKALR